MVVRIIAVSLFVTMAGCGSSKSKKEEIKPLAPPTQKADDTDKGQDDQGQGDQAPQGQNPWGNSNQTPTGTEIVGLYKEVNPVEGKAAGWFRVDNYLKVESTAQLPILVAGTNTYGIAPDFTNAPALSYDAAQGAYVTAGTIDYGNGVKESVATKAVVNGKDLVVAMTLKVPKNRLVATNGTPTNTGTYNDGTNNGGYNGGTYNNYGPTTNNGNYNTGYDQGGQGGYYAGNTGGNTNGNVGGYPINNYNTGSGYNNGGYYNNNGGYYNDGQNSNYDVGGYGYNNGGYANGGYDNGGYANGGYDNGGYANGGYNNGNSSGGIYGVNNTYYAVDMTSENGLRRWREFDGNRHGNRDDDRHGNRDDDRHENTDPDRDDCGHDLWGDRCDPDHNPRPRPCFHRGCARPPIFIPIPIPVPGGMPLPLPPMGGPLPLPFPFPGGGIPGGGIPGGGIPGPGGGIPGGGVPGGQPGCNPNDPDCNPNGGDTTMVEKTFVITFTRNETGK